MKKLFVFLLLLISMTATAQKDVTKFLGIPVDGSKTTMIQKLKAKGFVYNQKNDILTGQFNDYDVIISVVTNNNKVSRIVVADKNEVDESNIKIRFNKLCGQFERNKKYVSMEDQRIPDDEDISYRMIVDKKRYEAIFYKIPETFDSLAMAKEVGDIVLSRFKKEELDNPTEEILNELEELKKDYSLNLLSKSPVWFLIDEVYGKYRIIMYYDNEYNKSDGEDL